MRQSRESGSVRGGGGDVPTYSAGPTWQFPFLASCVGSHANDKEGDDDDSSIA